MFAAWASRAAKARWFAGPDEWKTKIRELDFRIGGRERGTNRLLDKLQAALQ